MTDRNNKESIEKDIKFLEEMGGTLKYVKTDITKYEHLEGLIEDWLEELQSLSPQEVVTDESISEHIEKIIERDRQTPEYENEHLYLRGKEHGMELMAKWLRDKTEPPNHT